MADPKTIPASAESVAKWGFYHTACGGSVLYDGQGTYHCIGAGCKVAWLDKTMEKFSDAQLAERFFHKEWPSHEEPAQLAWVTEGGGDRGVRHLVCRTAAELAKIRGEAAADKVFDVPDPKYRQVEVVRGEFLR